MDNLLNFARAVRLFLSNLTETRLLGIEIDVYMHFTVGGLYFYIVERRFGTRPAAITLTILIVAKEIIDIFLKSRARYIRIPTLEGLADIIVDMLMAIFGALAAYGLGRIVKHRQNAAHTS
jgi:hypothetical protein